MLEIQVCTLAGRLLRIFAIGDQGEVILGRDETCDIRIDSPRIAEEHCAIEASNGRHVLRDLGSDAGTIVDGRRIDRVVVEQGLEAIVGPALLRFVDPA